MFVMLPPARPSLHCSSTFLAPSVTLVTVRVSELISKEGRLFKRKLWSEDKIYFGAIVLMAIYEDFQRGGIKIGAESKIKLNSMVWSILCMVEIKSHLV